MLLTDIITLPDGVVIKPDINYSGRVGCLSGVLELKDDPVGLYLTCKKNYKYTLFKYIIHKIRIKFGFESRFYYFKKGKKYKVISSSRGWREYSDATCIPDSDPLKGKSQASKSYKIQGYDWSPEFIVEHFYAKNILRKEKLKKLNRL